MAASADSRDGRSSIGRERLNFCSRARRARDDQQWRTMGLEGSRKPMAPKECIRDAKQGCSSFGCSVHTVSGCEAIDTKRKKKQKGMALVVGIWLSRLRSRN